jgi:hypothetical protein
MNCEKSNICDELEETQAMLAFMEDATAVLLRTDRGTVPGEKIITGLYHIYSHIDTKLENIAAQVKALNA